MAGNDPIFTNSSVNAAYTNNSSVLLSNGAWGEVDKDPEMHCDDDFLEFMNSHQHHVPVGPTSPPVTWEVDPATGYANTTKYYIPGGFDGVPTNIGPKGVRIFEDAQAEALCGWECPRCKLCLAPHVNTCERCAPAWP